MAFHKKLLMFVLIQAGGIGFTIVICYILQQTVAEQFSVGVRYAFLGLAYSILLYLLIYRNSNFEYILNGLAFISLYFCLVLLVIFIGMYLSVFRPLFSPKFSLVSDCTITGMKHISLHGNEKYSALFMTFIDSQATQRIGLACISDNKDSSLFQTNIQPYRFLNIYQTYRIYESDSYNDEDQEYDIQEYTFSRFKLPSWLCSSAPFDYTNLQRSTCFASFYSVDSSVISSTFAEYSPSILQDNQINLVVLSEDDLLKNLNSFKLLIFLILYPFTMMSLQFYLVFFLIKLKVFSSINQNILKTNKHQQNINGTIEEQKEEDLQEDSYNKCKNKHTKRYQDSDNTVQTTQALALLNQTLSNQEQISRFQKGQYHQQQYLQNHNRLSRSHTYDVSTRVSQNYQQQYKTTQSSHRHPLKSNKSSEKHPLNLSLSKAISTIINENQDEPKNNHPIHSKTSHLSPPKFQTNSFQSRRSLNESSSAGMRSGPNHSISINFYNEDNHLFLEQYNISKPTPVSFQDSNFIIKNPTNTSIINNNTNNTLVFDSSLNPTQL